MFTEHGSVLQPGHYQIGLQGPLHSSAVTLCAWYQTPNQPRSTIPNPRRSKPHFLTSHSLQAIFGHIEVYPINGPPVAGWFIGARRRERLPNSRPVFVRQCGRLCDQRRQIKLIFWRQRGAGCGGFGSGDNRCTLRGIRFRLGPSLCVSVWRTRSVASFVSVPVVSICLGDRRIESRLRFPSGSFLHPSFDKGGAFGLSSNCAFSA